MSGVSACSSVRHIRQKEADINRIRALLPSGGDPFHNEKRQQLFDELAEEGGGRVTRQACRQGLKQYIGMRFHAAIKKKVIDHAFDAARDFCKPISGIKLSAGTLDQPGFMVVLMYLRRYLVLRAHLYVRDDAAGPLVVDIEQFQASLPLFISWNVPEAHRWEENPEAFWKHLDPCGNRVVDFDYFADFCLRRVLAVKLLGTDTDLAVDYTSERKLVIQRSCSGDMSPGSPKQKSSWRSIPLSSQTSQPRPPNHMSSIDWARIDVKLPTDRSEEGRAARKELWNRFDVNGNGILSLAETDAGLKICLRGTGADNCTPAVNRAFYAARAVAPPVASFSNNYIDLNEFRFLLVYLKHYIKLWEIFCIADTSGDRRIDIHEFRDALPKLSEWGILEAREWMKAPQVAFDKLDLDDCGMILFDEFADACLRIDIKACRDQESYGEVSDDRAEALRILLQAQPNLSSANAGIAFRRSPPRGTHPHPPARKTRSSSRASRQTGTTDRTEPLDYASPVGSVKRNPKKLSSEVLAALRSRGSEACRFCVTGGVDTGCFGRFCHGGIYHGLHQGVAWNFQVPGPGFYADNLPSCFGESPCKDLQESPYTAFAAALECTPKTHEKACKPMTHERAWRSVSCSGQQQHNT